MKHAIKDLESRIRELSPEKRIEIYRGKRRVMLGSILLFSLPLTIGSFFVSNLEMSMTMLSLGLVTGVIYLGLYCWMAKWVR